MSGEGRSRRPGGTWGEQGRGLTGAGRAMRSPAWVQGICEGRGVEGHADPGKPGKWEEPLEGVRGRQHASRGLSHRHWGPVGNLGSREEKGLLVLWGVWTQQEGQRKQVKGG